MGFNLIDIFNQGLKVPKANLLVLEGEELVGIVGWSSVCGRKVGHIERGLQACARTFLD